MRPIKGAAAVAGSESGGADLPNGQRKFCGYLRKKRNKVGGWSKLWFVLQDRLLVSYKSKEDYTNKLVSFKDVLNLMPGTQIRPLEGFNCRFTIETTTQTIYTFHCDDRDAYREWISKLLDCLATSSVSTPPGRLCPHFSVDDLTYAHAHITTRSFDSIIGAEPNVLSRKSHVEKILERNVDCLYEHSVKRQDVKQHIERMSITAENEYRRECYPKFKEQQRHSKLIAKQSTEERILQQFSSQCEIDAPALRLEHKVISEAPAIGESEPVYAVVDLRNKYVQRKKRLMAMQGKRWNSYESIFPTVLEQQEPIPEQPAEAIYEDGDAYYFEHVDDKASFRIPPKMQEDNIYEPINVGEQTSTAALTLRKYISRLTLNPFLRLHKTKKSPDSNDSKFTAHLNLMSPAKKSTQFSTVRSKFGVHRKSVQRRIRRFYGGNYEPNPLFQYHNEEAPIVLPSDKTSGNIIPVNKAPDLPTKNHTNCEPAASFFEQHKEKTRTFDSFPQFKRAVARIALFNSSPFKGASQKDSQDIANERNVCLND